MASTSAANEYLPEGYTFLNIKQIVSVKAEKELEALLKEAQNRDPDFNDMYIYNDYLGYALLNILDGQFKKMNTLVTKSSWDELYPLVEALTLWFSWADSWTQVDDGELVVAANKVYGALVVTMLRGLEVQDRLKEEIFPSLEDVLQNATRWGELMKDQGCSASYAKVCKAIAKRLFAGKEKERAEHKKKMVEEWASTLTGDRKQKVEAALAGKKTADDDDDEEDSDEEEDGKPWYQSAAAKDENVKSSDLTFSTAYKAYKRHYGGVPQVPLRGPPKWDLTKWSEAEKKPFKFDSMGDEDDF